MKDLLERASEVIVRQDLEKKLKSGKPLRVKLGIDPTGPRIHIGYASTLRHLRKLQDAGHKVVLIVGDFTAKVGDSSDKNSERPVLTDRDIKSNMSDYQRQLGMLVNLKKAELHYNSKWLAKLNLTDIIELAQQFSVAQMIERDNFDQRFRGGKRIGMHEFLYPLLQGYDSVEVKADIEIGATEQLFNLMAGRALQKHYGQDPQNIITFEILVGTDGRKMSKSWDNCIWIDDPSAEMFGKVMSLPDELIIHYYRVTTDIELPVIAELEKTLAAGANPRDAKASLAREIVRIYHGEKAALEAEAGFNRQFRDKEKPKDISEHVTGSKNLVEVMIESGLAPSKSEAKRLIAQSGVKVNDQIVGNPEAEVSEGDLIQVGKRNFRRIKRK